MIERTISLLTTGNHDVATGGHLYNRRMAEGAARHGAVVEMIEMDWALDPTRVPGQIVVDSLVAWAAAVRLLGRASRPLNALVHQVPGGVEGPEVLRRARRSADLALYRRCDVVIAASTFLGQALVASGIPEERIRIVPPGCDLPDEEGVPAYDLRRGRRMAILNVANWVPNKGILDLLDAVEPISPDEVVVHLVGSPELSRGYARAIRARLESPTLRGKVVVHGPIPKSRVGRFYAGADVFAFAGREEGYGTVVAEALGRGLPVVAWNSGNLANLFTDGDEGFLLPAGDVDGLIRVIRRLAGDAGLRATLAANAARRGAGLPTWQESASRFFAALDEAVSPSQGQSLHRDSAT